MNRLVLLSGLPRRPWWWVLPPWSPRLLGDIDAPVLDLWTFQSPEAYVALARDGRLRPQAHHRDPQFLDAYDWLERQAAHRLPTTGPHLLWAYARIQSRDLRSLARGDVDTVLLHLRVPRDLVLLLPVDEWHITLTGTPLTAYIPHESDDDLNARMDADDARWQAHLRAARTTDRRPEPHQLLDEPRAELERTWEVLFDPSWWTRTQAIQAVVHEIRPEHVVRAVHVHGRGPGEA